MLNIMCLMIIEELKIIIKVLELNPSMSVAIEDFNKLLKLESKYLVAEAENLLEIR